MTPHESEPDLVLDDDFVAAARYHEDSADVRAARSRRRTRRKRRGTRDLRGIVALLIAILLAAAYVGSGSWQQSRLGPSGAGDTLATSRSTGAPTRLVHGSRRLLPAPAVPTTGNSFVFLETVPGTDTPMTWNPCDPLHYVVRRADANAHNKAVLTAAIAEVSRRTGLAFVDDGVTDEQPSDERASYQPKRYGDRWAPVLVAWSTEAESPRLADAAGYAAPAAWGRSPRETRFVSGQIVLDAAELEQARSTKDGAAIERHVLLHELGHLVGLGHANDGQLMYDGWEDGINTYQDGDLHGLALVGRGSCQS